MDDVSTEVCRQSANRVRRPRLLKRIIGNEEHSHDGGGGGVDCGCGLNTGTPGGPGADKAKASEKDSTLKKIEDKIKQPEETFSLKTPLLATKPKQGETKEIRHRHQGREELRPGRDAEVRRAPKGVTFDPASPTIKKGDTEVKVMVKVADDAAVGDFTVKVVGKPSKGDEATNESKLTIEKK